MNKQTERGKKMVVDLYWFDDYDLKENVTHLIVDYERKEYYYTNRETHGMVRNRIQVKYKGDLTYYVLMLELEGFNFVDYTKANS